MQELSLWNEQQEAQRDPATITRQLQLHLTLAVSAPAIDTELGNGFAEETSHRMPPRYSVHLGVLGVPVHTHITHASHREGTDNQLLQNNRSCLINPASPAASWEAQRKRRTSRVFQTGRMHIAYTMHAHRPGTDEVYSPRNLRHSNQQQRRFIARIAHRLPDAYGADMRGHCRDVHTSSTTTASTTSSTTSTTPSDTGIHIHI